MFFFKKVAIIFSMIMISNVGTMPESSTSFFISWFIFLLLILLDYIDLYNMKKIDERKWEASFYLLGIIITSILTTFSCLASFGLITVNESLILSPNSDYVLIETFNYFLLEYNISVEFFILSCALIIVALIIGEIFMNPLLTYKEKHSIKSQKTYNNKGEVI